LVARSMMVRGALQEEGLLILVIFLECGTVTGYIGVERMAL